MAIHGDVVIVGEPLQNLHGAHSGLAWRFDRHYGGTDNWGLRAQFAPSDLAAGDRFGSAIALDSETLLITSPNDGASSPSYPTGHGTAYAFDLSETCECAADLDGSGDVAFADLLTLLTAWGPCPDCPADLDASGAVGFPDLLSLLTSWGSCP